LYRRPASPATYPPSLHDALPILTYGDACQHPDIAHERVPMTVTGPDFLALQVRDLEASAAFYETHLGLTRAPASPPGAVVFQTRSEEHTSELQSRENLVRRLPLE